MMNELEELMRVSHIPLPRKLFYQEVKEMFDNLSRNTKYEFEIYTDQMDRFTRNEPVYNDVKKISGMVKERDHFLNGSSFSMPRGFVGVASGKDESIFDGIYFETIVDYSLEEHRPEEVQIWRDVRAHVEKYFEDHQSDNFPIA